MKKHLFIIYTIVMGLIFAITLGYAGFSLVSEYNHGDLRTQIRFEKFVTSVKQIAEKNTLGTTDFRKKIENAVGDTDDFVYLQISIDGKTYFTYPENRADFENIVQFSQENNKSIKNRSKYFTVKNNSFYINSSLYILRPTTIYYHLRTSFLVILIGTIITIILCIYLHITGKESDVISIHTVDEDITYDDETVVQNDVIEASVDETETNINADEDTDDEIDVVTEEEIEVNSDESNNVISEPVNLPTEETVPVDIKDEKQNPEGLFSPVTGLGWESYLNTRLSNELNRATSSEIDLSLFEVKLDQVERDSAVMKQICEYLFVEFQFKDLLFEYKEDSIIAIKISMNIDEALVLGEKLYDEIKKLLDNNGKVYIGITSRTIRMVSAERLLKEADEAVSHAIQEPDSPVIAFRADATKYREFLENNK